MARLVLLITLCLAVATACGSDADATDADFDAAFDCSGLADRWVVLQQSYLDRLGEADAAEIAEGSARTQAAGLFIGQAMIEQVRDVQAVGCQDELVSGSDALCSRIDQLEPAGEAGRGVVASLRETCGD